MPQYTSKFGAALDAFKEVIEAITFPTSGDTVFPTVVVEINEPQESELYPQAIIRVRSVMPDDDNGRSLYQVDIEVEVRQAVVAEDAGEAAILGAHRTDDEAIGAGLVDLVEALTEATQYLSTDDDARIDAYIELVEGSGFDGGDTNAATIVAYTGLLKVPA